ncbi:MAG: hypothetical protein FWF75_04740 [Propionibacteriaceae bacterium]|nr:hypothetical protein [Propionibacteriaceae bacterium]
MDEHAPRQHHRRPRGPIPRTLARLARIPLWALLIVMIGTLALVLSFASAAPDYVAPPPPPSQTTPTPAPTPSSPPPSAPTLPQLGQAITTLENQYQAAIGVAISPAFTPPDMPVSAWHGGSLTSGYAWSTIDLPIAVAVAADTKEPPDLTYLLTQAFNESSPAGDQALWQWLGDDQSAADVTTAVLRAGTDENTTIPIGDPGTYAVYSQTQWALADQATWLGAAYCTPGSWYVMSFLSTPPQDQRFGLARLANAMTKTSWGTQPNGALSVRQAALLTLGDGKKLAVSVAVVPMDKSLATATTILNDLSFELNTSASGLAGNC